MFRVIAEIWYSFKEYFILVVLLIASLLIISNSEHKSVKNIRTFIFGSFASFSGVFSDVLSISDIKSENERLRNRNAQLMIEVNQLIESAIENEELKQLLKFQDSTNYSIVPVRIILKSITASQGNYTLDKGTTSGVEVGMPVVNDRGLIGIVESSSPTNAIVRTLKNTNLKLMVKDQRSRYQGVLRWNGEFLTVTNLPKTAEIELGDRIISSPSSSIIPITFPIGKVTRILNPEKGMFNDIIITSFAELERIENAFVVLMKKEHFEFKKETRK